VGLEGSKYRLEAANDLVVSITTVGVEAQGRSIDREVGQGASVVRHVTQELNAVAIELEPGSVTVGLGEE